MSDMEQAAKSFFKRPEGKTGVVFLVALLGAAGWGLYWALPFIIELLTNTIHAALLAGALAAILFVVLDKRVRTLVSYGFKSVMRFITGLIVEIDPIGILKGYAENLRKRLEDMRESMSQLNGQKKKLAEIIKKNENERQHSLALAKQAHERPDTKSAFILQSRQAGRLQKSNMTLQSLLNRMEAMSKVLKKMYEVAEFTSADIDSEVQVKTAERAAIKASYGAFTSARRIIQGDVDQKALFDQAMEHLADDYAMKVGEIELFMEMSDGFIKSVDLENGVYEQDALDQFEQWEKKADQLLQSPSDCKRIAEPTGVRIDGIGEEVEVPTASEYGDLFDSSIKK